MRLLFPRCSTSYNPYLGIGLIFKGRGDANQRHAMGKLQSVTKGHLEPSLATYSQLCSGLNTHRLHHCVRTTERGANRHPVYLSVASSRSFTHHSVPRSRTTLFYVIYIYSSAQQPTRFSQGTSTSRSVGLEAKG